MAPRKGFKDYHYKKHKHDDSVQHIGIRRTATMLETVEVIVFYDGKVRIHESTYHVPSGRITSTPPVEFDGEEGTEEAQYRIDEMLYHWRR